VSALLCQLIKLIKNNIMKETINNKGIITKIFAKTIEDSALQQIEKLADSDAYSNNKIRIMPDSHAGNGCTIGTTIKITDKVVPNTVGVDINCGMLCINFHDTLNCGMQDFDRIVNEVVPCGFNVHDKAIKDVEPLLQSLYCKEVVDVELANRSLGTLGGGNHFIEVDVDDTGNKYLVIHSGSRNLGVRVCKYYQDMAIKTLSDNNNEVSELISRYKQEGRQNEISEVLKSIPKKIIDKELAYLEGNNLMKYLNDMRIVGIYANLNRMLIANSILERLGKSIKNYNYDMFETLHNYIDINNMILRKGAISAQQGEKVIIPMNMRDGSLICIGKGNEDWNYSAPHGAGRLMSRSKAKENINIDEFKKSMDGIYSTSVCDSTIDESPMAYKPMDEIIECIKDTVDIINTIKPIYNFKAK
jgi:tRNA-splicing ligase RtcB